MIFQLGTYKFDGNIVPNSFSDSRQSKYEEVGSIGTKPTVQLNGEELNQISLDVYLDASFCDPEKEFELLNASRKKSEVMRLINGDGKNYGKFVITAISQEVDRVFNNGHVWSCTLNIELKEYNSIADNSNEGKALSINNPMVELPLIPVPISAFDIDTSIKLGKIEFAKMDDLNKTTTALTKMKRLSQSAKKYYDEASTKLDIYTSIYYRAKDVSGQIKTVSTYLSDISDACDINSLDSAFALKEKCSESIESMKSEYSKVVAFMVSREGGTL